MAYKATRRDLITLQRDLDALMVLCLHHTKGDYDKAFELCLTPLPKAGGSTAMELARLGFTDQAMNIINEMMKTARLKREAAAQKLAARQRMLEI